jgi:hypothetical protein
MYDEIGKPKDNSPLVMTRDKANEEYSIRQVIYFMRDRQRGV